MFAQYVCACDRGGGGGGGVERDKEREREGYPATEHQECSRRSPGNPG